ncbi:uncharacterized protein PAC_09115 [Phialocephala subalpina]|uniref:SAC3/GANP/THP3 conserved domain-containing protein n=1 Tax=Phialocephala subalpina TaxID=576137 RepID=A0A1L7X2H2_9HELO|nr:uncharacterized protein PAC_09115 [Phialocephala subalpina]
MPSQRRNGRARRGQANNFLRSQGEGTTSRGAHNSSDTDRRNSSNTSLSNTYENDRLENAAKRTRREMSTTHFGAPSGAHAPTISSPFAPNPFTQKNPNPFSPSPNTSSSFGQPSGSKPTPSAQPNPFNTARTGQSKFGSHCDPTEVSMASFHKTPETSASLAAKIETLLSRDRLHPPTWPSVDFNRNPGLWESYTKDGREFRKKYRASLTRAGLIDDPDVPKKLEFALVFKGTCDEMCPELEAAERIVERRYDQFEKDYLGNGEFSALPNPSKMIKKLARSAAGQDNPLPVEVRTVPALKRTLDYLIDEILGKMELASVHGFVWDRTRAIRRDLAFYPSWTNEELIDRVYILETIARFHVVSLHQMSKKGIKGGFVEQQELEQLSKTLISILEAYGDCRKQQVECENEAEFRAYYLLFNRGNPGILKTAQDWGYKFWVESPEVQIAASLVEAFQNTWDAHGPLKNPATQGSSEFDIAQCAFSKFFSIVEDGSVSYTMACFAEICFNDIRKSIMTTILKSYRRQKDQTKDWTLSRLNAYLRFDEEADILSWGEQHGLHFESGDEEEYLSFDQSTLKNPWSAHQQQHSYALVERKRGDHSLTDVIRTTVYDTSEEEEYPIAEEEDDDLFVKDDSDWATSLPQPTAAQEDIQEDSSEEEPSHRVNDVAIQSESSTTNNTSTPRSLFDRIGTPKTFGSDFFTSSPKESSTPKQDPPSIFAKPPGNEAPSVFTQPAKEHPSATQAKPPFSFPTQPPTSSIQLGGISDNATTCASAPTAPLTFGLQPSLNAPEAIQPMGKPATATQAPVPQPSLFPTAPTPTASIFPATDTPIPPPSFGTNPQPPAASGSSMTTPPNFTNTPTTQPESFDVPQPTPPPNRPRKILRVAEWVTLGEGGLLDEFTQLHTEKLLWAVAEMYVAEQQKIADEQAAAQAQIEADHFRYKSLATRFGRQWRETVRRLGLKRRGREARKARKAFAESTRAAKAAKKANLVEDFRSSTQAKRREGLERRDSLESLLDETGVLNGVHDAEEELRSIVKEEIRAVMRLDRSGSSNKRPRSEESTNSMASSNRHKRGRSDNPLGRSLLSDPTYLDGGSRIHLMKDYNDQDERRRQVSGVQTDYFRLKARGITTLHNGAPLASSAAKDIVHQKHSFDGISKPKTPHQQKVQSWARSVPAKPVPAFEERSPTEEYENKKEQTEKRGLDDNDEKLFARLRKVREQMDEGAEWFRKQISRSQSKSKSSS